MTLVQSYEKTISENPKFPGILMVEPSKITTFRFEGEIMKEFGYFEKGDKVEVDVLPIELGNKLIFKTDGEESQLMEIELSQIKNIGAFEGEKGFMNTKNTLVKIFLKNNSEIVLYFDNYKIKGFISLVNSFFQIDNSYWEFSEIDFKNRDVFDSSKIYFKTPFLANGEKLLWRYVGLEGVLDKKATFVMALTNFRALIYFFETHECESIQLSNVDEILVSNSRQIFKSKDTESFSLIEPNNATLTSAINKENGIVQTIGDVAFIKNGKVLITFGQMADPNGLANLAKNIKENVIIREK